MEAICTECNLPCTARVRNNGIGKTEYWGYIRDNIVLEVESDCCDAPCHEEYNESILEPKDLRGDRYA